MAASSRMEQAAPAPSTNATYVCHVATALSTLLQVRHSTKRLCASSHPAVPGVRPVARRAMHVFVRDVRRPAQDRRVLRRARPLPQGDAGVGAPDGRLEGVQQRLQRRVAAARAARRCWRARICPASMSTRASSVWQSPSRSVSLAKSGRGTQRPQRRALVVQVERRGERGAERRCTAPTRAVASAFLAASRPSAAGAWTLAAAAAAATAVGRKIERLVNASATGKIGDFCRRRGERVPITLLSASRVPLTFSGTKPLI